MADTRIAYGLAKKHGIDTTGMSPKEVWDALKEKGISLGKDSEAEKERLTKKYSNGDERPSKSSVRLQLFAAKISEQSIKELKKSERSFLKRIEQHKNKIANPSANAERWGEMSDRERQGLILHWQKEIDKFEQQLDEVRRRLNGK